MNQIQSRVVIRFTKPQLRHFCYGFMRIKLHREHLAKAEEKRHDDVIGIVKIEIPVSFVRNPTEPMWLQVVDGCVLVMDRRYDNTILDVVYRTAGAVSDLLGVKIK